MKTNPAFRHHGALLLISAGLACTFNPPPISESDASTGTTDATGTTGTPGDSTAAEEETGDPATGDTTASPTGGECSTAKDCDDGVACTTDECVDGACVNSPSDDACDDGVSCTIDSCDAVMGCSSTASDDRCNDSIPCTTDMCDPTRGCIGIPDDSLCDDGVACTVDTCDTSTSCQSVPDDTACNDGLGCTADVCDATLDCQVVASALIFNGSTGSGFGSTAPEDAAAALGFTAISTNSDVDFNNAFDAGGFQVVIIDDPSNFTVVPDSTRSRLQNWVNAGGRLIFGFWNLDSDAEMQDTLGVLVSASFDAPQLIHPDTASPVDLFSNLETFPDPLMYNDIWADNGDELDLAGGGFVAGRFNDAIAGPGAILVTQSERVITNGFVLTEVAVSDGSATDADGDSIPDGEELLRNELAFVCGQD
ncbi:MAG: hypothetical protein AAF799_28305 [Myxococcota bacterium]